MWWTSPEFKERCAKLGIEPIIERDSESIRFICAKIPDKKTQSEILKDAPVNEIKFEWVEDLKTSTTGAIDRALKQLAMAGVIKDSSFKVASQRRVKIELTNNEEFPNQEFLARDNKAISTLETLLRNDGYVDHYDILVDGKELAVYDRCVTQNLAGREDRGKITESDVTDVTILLETCNSVEDFLKELG